MQSNKSLANKINKDIEQTGYPSELVVGKILDAKGRELNFNVYYIDEDEKKGREIDVVATDSFWNHEPTVHIEHSLICAVKKSKKPWVIFSTEATGFEEPGWHRLCVSEGIDHNILPSNKLDEKSTIHKFKRFGHAYHVAFQGNNSEILDALCSSVKAAENHREHYKEWYEEDRSREGKRGIKSSYYSLVLLEPLIILDGQLFEAYLDSKNNLIVKSIKYIPMCFGYLSVAYRHAEHFGNYIVEAVTLDALSSFVSKKNRWLNGIKKTLVNNLSKTDRKSNSV